MLLSGASAARAVQAERMSPTPMDKPLATAFFVAGPSGAAPSDESLPEPASSAGAPALADNATLVTSGPTVGAAPAASGPTASVAPTASATTEWAPAALLPRRPGTNGHRVNVQVTAYSASVEEGTAWGITASGRPARSGTVAVDPTFIPLGSQLRIAGLPGIYRAEDTGGGVRGAHVDVFLSSRAEALRFGRRLGVPVEILE
jgi:3D (Asp-Asp-Asp) domain-containing protein